MLTYNNSNSSVIPPIIGIPKIGCDNTCSVDAIKPSFYYYSLHVTNKVDMLQSFTQCNSSIKDLEYFEIDTTDLEHHSY